MKRRVRVYPFPHSELLKLLTTGATLGGMIVTKGLPDGAKIVGISTEDPFNIGIVVEHPGFDTVAEGDHIPTSFIEVDRGE